MVRRGRTKAGDEAISMRLLRLARNDDSFSCDAASCNPTPVFSVEKSSDVILKINPQNPQPRLISKVADVLREGGVIAYPTDTQYGIGCDLYQKKAIERLIRLKKRSPHKPLSFICSDLKDISQYAKVSNYAYRTMRRLLPGPYTFILACTQLVPKIVLSRRSEAGIRVPNNKICLSLVADLGHPIVNTTAALEGDVALTSPEEIEAAFKGLVELVIDQGEPPPGVPSTVVSLLEDVPEVIREGLGDVNLL